MELLAANITYLVSFCMSQHTLRAIINITSQLNMSKKPSDSAYLHRGQGRFSRHQNKKPKKAAQETDSKQLLEYVDKNQDEPLLSIYESQKYDMPGHYELGIWRKNMNLLTRCHLPLYVKLIDVYENDPAKLNPSKAFINPKKNTKTDILIEDPITQKTRLIKMDGNSHLLSPQQIVFYQVNFTQFQSIFQKTGLAKKEDLRKIFNHHVQENQYASKNDVVFWPAAVLEGLYYNIQSIADIIKNFEIDAEENKILYSHLLEAINQPPTNLGNNLNQANQEMRQEQIAPHLQGQNDQRDEQQLGNIPQNQFSLPAKGEVEPIVQEQIQQQSNKGIVTEKKFCVWLIGTAQFIFTNKNITPWHTLNNETIRSLFSTSLCSGFVKEANQIIESLNRHKRLKKAQLKADEYKNFLYRLGTYKTEHEAESWCIPLRFQYVKGIGKRVLVRILREQKTQLRWVPTQTVTVNYTLPNVTKKQMMYLVLKKKPFDVVVDFFYRQFLCLPEPNISEVFKSYFPHFHMTQQDAHYQRCKDCNYIIRAMPFKCCFFCKVFCHEQCVIQSRRKASYAFLSQIFPQEAQIPWICEKCQPCTVCLQAVRDDFFFCSICFSYSHFQCGRIKGLEQSQSKMNQLKINDKYVCQFCLKCKMCSHKLKDNQYLLMGSQFYCCECSEKIKSNNHCHACMKKKEGNNSVKWIQCGAADCLKWIHQNCDEPYKNVYSPPSANDPYLCLFCREVQKRKIYAEVIDCISVFDEAQFFTQPSYLDIPLYNTIISQPMCFQVMKQKAHQGKYDQRPIQHIYADFQLIISNALKFNMPKELAHVQAKILKILGEKTLQKFQPLLTKIDLRALIEGTIFEQIKKINVQLHRQINNHYLEILLNYKAQKSFVEVRQSKRKPNDYKLQDELKFRSGQILNNLFKNSTIIFHLKKQKVKIANLFTMPKSENQIGAWYSIKGDICFYHNSKDIIFTCEQCGQSYCCMRQCIRHRICTSCGQKGCRCDNFDCGCAPIKQKEKKKMLQKKLLNKYGDPFKSEKDNLMDITQMYKYCLKCVEEKIQSRTCAACEGLCCWGYFKCPDCSKVWHKQCYPHILHVSFVSNPQGSARVQYHSDQASIASSTIPNKLSQINKVVPTATCSVNYCNQCLSNNHANNYQQALTLQSKSRLVKVSKITRYMRIFIQVYFNEGIRLTPYEIQQLILDNYDQFSVREQLFKEYELNYNIIERFRDFSFKTNAAIQRSCNQYVNDYAQVKKSILLSASHTTDMYGWTDNLSYLPRCRNLWRKYFNTWILTQNVENVSGTLQPEPCPIYESANWQNRFYLETIAQVREKVINEAYAYKDYNSHVSQTYRATQNIIQLLEPHAQPASGDDKNVDRIQEEITSQSFCSIKQYRNYLRSLNYVPTLLETYYKSDHMYRFTLIYHPRVMPFEYRLNPTFKKKSNLEEATKQFLLGIYQQSKFCLRKGTTCILKYSNGNKDTKDYWCVLKRWAKGKREMQITLQKKIGLWFLKIDNKHERIVHQIQQIINQINKCHIQWKITSFKELGQFLGFTIYEPLYKANHFTTFLQTNLVDEMPLLDKMNKIVELYDSFSWGENGIFQKLALSSLAQNTPTQPANNSKIIPYQYSITKNKPQYLTKKPTKALQKNTKKLQRRVSGFNGAQLQASQNYFNSQNDPIVKRHPFITFEDLKRYLADYNVMPNPIKSQISLKNNPILNQVFIAPSKIHKLGLFSRKNMKKNSIVIQYIGQIVSQSIADLRQKKFHYGCYLFSILKENYKQNQDKKDIIDATFRGNMARYLNHSCDPNCKARTEYLNGSPRIIIYTIRDIQQFEQITYDYQFNVDAVQKLQCTCKAKNCQGRLN